MVFNSQKQFQQIIMCLSVLRYIFRSNSGQQLNDVNKSAEKFFKRILNITLDLHLKDMNQIQNNYPAIDLGDESARVCFQITAENTSTKIEKTVKTFVTHGLEKDYDELRILIITTKKQYTKSFTDPGTKFVFKADSNIWDIDDLLEHIEALEEEKLQELHDYITQELSSIIDLFSPSDSLLRDAEKTFGKPLQNGNAFFKHFDFRPEELKAGYLDLQKFYQKLAVNIPKHSREFLFAFMLHGKPEGVGGTDCINCSPTKIESVLRIDKSKTLAHYQILEGEGIAGCHEHGLNNIFVKFHMSNQLDLLCLLKDMFPDKDELKDLIVNCNFEKLDS